MPSLVFLKLGGSLITDKSQPYVPRLDKIDELCSQIARFIYASNGIDAPQTQLLLGHGSGSFGHTAARKHGTRLGIQGQEGWRGFAEVHLQASALNHYVMEALHKAGVSALPFPPSASLLTREHEVLTWDVTPIQRALSASLLPVIYGDVVFDESLGGTIFSTEDLFEHLAMELRPSRILLAGLEAGVWEAFPARNKIVDKISPETYKDIKSGVGRATGADVTGGMQSKVEQMLRLVERIPGLEAVIFSAEPVGALFRSLNGESLGTKICL
jgi:isopentenyl phosphate kinase